MQVTQEAPEYEIIAPKEAVISWKNDPISQQVKEIIMAEKLNSGVRMGNGETLGENIVQNTARAVGYIEGLDFLLALIELKLTKEDEDEPRGKRNEKGSKNS